MATICTLTTKQKRSSSARLANKATLLSWRMLIHLQHLTVDHGAERHVTDRDLLGLHFTGAEARLHPIVARIEAQAGKRRLLAAAAFAAANELVAQQLALLVEHADIAAGGAHRTLHLNRHRRSLARQGSIAQEHDRFLGFVNKDHVEHAVVIQVSEGNGLGVVGALVEAD